MTVYWGKMAKKLSSKSLYTNLQYQVQRHISVSFFVARNSFWLFSLDLTVVISSRLRPWKYSFYLNLRAKIFLTSKGLVDVVKHHSMLFHFVFSIDSPICTIFVFSRETLCVIHESGNEFSFLKGDLRKTQTIKTWHDYSAQSIGNKMASKEKHLNTEYFSITKELH